MQNTQVKAPEDRKRLYKQDSSALESSKDPMIQLVLLVDSEARAVRKIIETQDEIKRQAYGDIASARFAVQGSSTYPDATFTLRLAFGEAKGYDEGGQRVPFQTLLSGLYERAAEHEQRPPFNIPPLWEERKNRIDPETPYNFVSTADIIGGNSGSPVINRKGEVVGLIFDGNIYSLVLDFAYTDEKARAISVHSKAITEALEKVYGATDLAAEILGKNRLGH